VRLTLAILALLGACDAPEESPNAPRADVVRALAEQVAQGHYDELALRAEALHQAATTLCANPDADTFAAAQAGWWAAKAPWARAEVIQFGPVVEYPERLGPKIDDWPVSAGRRRGADLQRRPPRRGGLRPHGQRHPGPARRGVPALAR
jgi:predicted lipoprotein